LSFHEGIFTHLSSIFQSWYIPVPFEFCFQIMDYDHGYESFSRGPPPMKKPRGGGDTTDTKYAAPPPPSFNNNSSNNNLDQLLARADAKLNPNRILLFTVFNAKFPINVEAHRHERRLSRPPPAPSTCDFMYQYRQRALLDIMVAKKQKYYLTPSKPQLSLHQGCQLKLKKSPKNSRF
jgi:hypothetical protein